MINKEEIKNKKHKQQIAKEPDEIFSAKKALDSSYKFRILWTPIFYVLIGFCVLFFIWGLITTLGLYNIVSMDTSTASGISIACGFVYMFLFAILWYFMNYINTKLYTTSPEFVRLSNTANPLAIKYAKLSSIFSAIMRIDLCACTVISGLCFISAGYAVTDYLETAKIIAVIGICCMGILEIVGCVFYWLFNHYKIKSLDLLVVKK